MKEYLLIKGRAIYFLSLNDFIYKEANNKDKYFKLLAIYSSNASFISVFTIGDFYMFKPFGFELENLEFESDNDAILWFKLQYPEGKTI